jgi:hypothetical protein
MSDVCTCIKQFLECCSGHFCFLFNFLTLFINPRAAALPISRIFRSSGIFQAAFPVRTGRKVPKIL